MSARSIAKRIIRSRLQGLEIPTTIIQRKSLSDLPCIFRNTELANGNPVKPVPIAAIDLLKCVGIHWLSERNHLIMREKNFIICTQKGAFREETPPSREEEISTEHLIPILSFFDRMERSVELINPIDNQAVIEIEAPRHRSYYARRYALSQHSLMEWLLRHIPVVPLVLKTGFRKYGLPLAAGILIALNTISRYLPSDA